MKTLVTLACVAVLAGCSSLPQGSDTNKYLPTPVDVSKMTPHEMTLKAKNGDEYNVRRFEDVLSNKWYDSDGIPVNDKKFRILSNGMICEPEKTAMWTSNPMFDLGIDRVYCTETEIQDKANNSPHVKAIIGLALIVAPVTTAVSVGGAFAGEGVKAAVGVNNVFTEPKINELQKSQ